MKKTGKIILSTLLIASISLTAAPLTAPIISSRMVTSASAAENSIQWSYSQSTQTLTFSGNGTITQSMMNDVFDQYPFIKTMIVSDGIEVVENADLIATRIDKIPQNVILGKDVVECFIRAADSYQVSSQNKNLTAYDGALYTADLTELLLVPKNKTNLTYPQQLRTIGTGAYNANVGSVIVIPWGVTTIRQYGLMNGNYIIPDTVTFFSLEGDPKYPFASSNYLWEGENETIQKASDLYTDNDEGDFASDIWQAWSKYDFRRISDICKGIDGEPIHGWYTVSGYRYYFGTDGKPLKGWQTIDGNRYYFRNNGAARTGLVTIAESYSDSLGQELSYYFNQDGTLASNTTITYSGRTYYINEMGVASTTPSSSSSSKNGLVTENGNTYYYVNGVKQTGLQYINEKAYIFDSNGVMQKSGWYDAEGHSFYLNDYGAGVVKCWRLGTDGKYRYLKADGTMAVNEWVVDYGKTYYVGSDGKKYTGTKTIDGKTYTFDENGVLQGEASTNTPSESEGQAGTIYDTMSSNPVSATIRFSDLDGKTYCYANGQLAIKRWVSVNGNWYLTGDDGALCKSKWVYTGFKWENYWYWFGGSGKMMSNGWLKLADGKWYYFRSGGQMATGWIKDGNKWYYLTGSGAMAANRWVKSGNYWYYVGSNGAMLTNTITPDGYRVDSEGRWV